MGLSGHVYPNLQDEKTIKYLDNIVTPIRSGNERDFYNIDYNFSSAPASLFAHLEKMIKESGNILKYQIMDDEIIGTGKLAVLSESDQDVREVTLRCDVLKLWTEPLPA